MSRSPGGIGLAPDQALAAARPPPSRVLNFEACAMKTLLMPTNGRDAAAGGAVDAASASWPGQRRVGSTR